MSTSTNRDKLVRATDLDALSCRLSANGKGYFSPPDRFIADLLKAYESNLQYCSGYTQLSAGRTIRTAFGGQKFPLINRGTYVRTVAIDEVVSRFIVEHGKCQIVALGGGSDTRAFRVLEQYPNTVEYTEIDFPELTRIKKIAISKLPVLRQLLGDGSGSMAPIEITSKEQMDNLDPELHLPNYHLVAFDLRKLDSEGFRKFAFLRKNVPTLLISECVLCYLTPDENISVLKFWKSLFSELAVVLYDPMSLDDVFGQTMAQNLSRRGLDLLTFTKYPDLAARKQLFQETLGYKAYLTDLALVGGYGPQEESWINPQDSVRVARLEMVDEVEEIHLLLRHYCLIYAEHGMRLQFVQLLQWRM